MKKLIYLIVVIVVLGLIVVGCLPVVPPAEQGDLSTPSSRVVTTWTVGPDVGDDYTTIQAAIDALTTSPGDTISVKAGTYAESVAINKNNLTILGDSSQPKITGGLKLDTNLSGLTLKNFYVTGTVDSLPSYKNSVVRMYGSITNLVIDNCVFDGEYVSGRLGFSGGQLEGDVTVTNSEFKEILGWALFESRSGSGGDGSAMNIIVFANNFIHHCNGSVVFRGLSTDRTDLVEVYGNTWNDIGGNNSEIGQQWAALEVNRTKIANVYDNTVDGVSMGEWLEGQAFQFWDIDILNVYNNNIINNYQGIYIYGGDGTFAVPGGSISHNNIAGNFEYGIEIDSTATGGPLDATRNWWGSPTGPYRQLPNSKWVGKGDKVGSNVDYKPWLPHPFEFWNNQPDLSPDCTTIQDGVLLTSDGVVITTGYDEWGYDYQAHMFNGYYCDSYRDAEWCQPWRDVRLMMCWNDAWLSNMDCDGDGLLDRHYGYESYIGSGAWLTNHQSGEYLNDDGETCKWNYFVKIVAAPSDATSAGGVWYAVDGIEIGPVIWGAFAIVQQVENDACAGIHGVQYLSPSGPGFGQYGPE